MLEKTPKKTGIGNPYRHAFSAVEMSFIKIDAAAQTLLLLHEEENRDTLSTASYYLASQIIEHLAEAQGILSPEEIITPAD